jgi:molybdenum cofactor synthesis domain-containing protein
MIASLAAFGYADVSVAKRPRVSVFTTGSEVVEINKAPGVDQIRNSNSAMLKALAEPIGGDVTLVPTAVDDLCAIKDVISSAAASSEMIVITGGVSVGKYDLTKAALIELGAEVFFDRVRLKPGKPAVFAGLGQTLVFGLPGNPMSAAVTFYLFVRKALLLMQSANEPDLRRAKAISGGSFKAARERDTYFPARLDIDGKGRVIVSPVKWIGSSDFIGFGRSDALAFVPGGEKVEAGDQIEVLIL